MGAQVSTATEFEVRLRSQVDFPSPSRVASEVITLARDPDIEVAKVAQAISRDPAMTAKILRIANSAFYAQRRPSKNLRQALVIVGLNAALTLALSFSLVSTLKGCRPHGIDYRRYWRRTLMAATACRALGESLRVGQEEDLFLAGLLQDVAILAIARTSTDFYAELSPEATHAALVAHEKKSLGKDHAAFGAMLLKSWNLPERLWHAVELSHSPETLDAKSEEGRFIGCVAMGSELADAVLAADRPAALDALANRMRKFLGLSDEKFTEVVTRILNLIPEAEDLYETSIIDQNDAEALLAQAREMLTLRNLHALREVHALQETAGLLLSRTEQLEDANRRDGLTGVMNRAWLDRHLEREFTQAVMFQRSLSVAFIDLDHFKKVNDTFGHQMGDRILRSCAQAMQSSVRGSDVVARYGGEEFVVLLPGTDDEMARQVCERMLAAIREIRHDANNTSIVTTVSIGLATYTPQHRFASATELMDAADHALYAAKLRGRNRIDCFAELEINGTPPRARESA
jgi:diguanylate cyclase (GGDEF)-like protein